MVGVRHPSSNQLERYVGGERKAQVEGGLYGMEAVRVNAGGIKKWFNTLPTFAKANKVLNHQQNPSWQEAPARSARVYLPLQR